MTRRVLASANVGPGGNSQYVLRVVSYDITFGVEAVDVRGTVMHKETYFSEHFARGRANTIYRRCAQDNGYHQEVW